MGHPTADEPARVGGAAKVVEDGRDAAIGDVDGRRREPPVPRQAEFPQRRRPAVPPPRPHPRPPRHRCPVAATRQSYERSLPDPRSDAGARP